MGIAVIVIGLNAPISVIHGRNDKGKKISYETTFLVYIVDRVVRYGRV